MQEIKLVDKRKLLYIATVTSRDSVSSSTVAGRLSYDRIMGQRWFGHEMECQYTGTSVYEDISLGDFLFTRAT